MPNVKPRQVLELCDAWEQYVRTHKIWGLSGFDFPISQNFREISQVLKDWTADQSIINAGAFTELIESASQLPGVSEDKRKNKLREEATQAEVVCFLLLSEIRERAKHLEQIQAATTPTPDVKGAESRAVMAEKELQVPQQEPIPAGWLQAFLSLIWKHKKIRIPFIVIAGLIIIFILFWQLVIPVIPEKSKEVIFCNILPQYCPKR